MVLLDTGCLCCTVRGDLVQTLTDLHAPLRAPPRGRSSSTTSSARSKPESSRTSIAVKGDPIADIGCLEQKADIRLVMKEGASTPTAGPARAGTL